MSQNVQNTVPKKVGICNFCGQPVALRFQPKSSPLGMTDYDSCALAPEDLPHPTEVAHNYRLDYHRLACGDPCDAQNTEDFRFGVEQDDEAAEITKGELLAAEVQGELDLVIKDGKEVWAIKRFSY